MLAALTKDDLLDELYAGVYDAERMVRFTHSAAIWLGSHTGAWTSREIGPQKGQALSISGALRPGDIKPRYDSEFGAAADNLWYHRALPKLSTGDMLYGEALATKQEMKATRYYADFLRTIDTTYSIALCAHRNDRSAVILTFCRSESSGAYDDVHRARAVELAPHVAQVQRLTQAHAAAAGPGGRNVLLVPLDRRLHVLHASPGLEALADSGVLNVRRGAAVAPTNPLSHTLWKAHVQATMSQPGAVADPVPLYDRSACLVAIARLLQCGLFRRESTAQFQLHLTLLRTCANPDVAEAMKRLFRLTAAEARFAVALAGCSDVSETAVALSISIETARSRLKSIFAKTGTHKQGALVALVNALGAQCS